MAKNPFEIVKDFEDSVKDFTGAKYAVAVDSCTSALFLCLQWRLENTKFFPKANRRITIPKHTFYGLPIYLKRMGYTVDFSNEKWSGQYILNPTTIIDSALQLTKEMFSEINHAYICLSFNYNKPLSIGRGGMILHDDFDADDWFRKARFFGRNEVPVEEDEAKFLGWKAYMNPEDAAKGLMLMNKFEGKIVKQTYPDLSKWEIFK